MKNKSLFSQIIFVVLLAAVCLIATVIFSLLAGTQDENILNFSDLNFSNVILVLFVGGFISCVTIGISILLVTRTAWLKTKDYFKKAIKKEKQKNEMYQSPRA